MVEQDIIEAAEKIGYLLEGAYPVEPYYLRMRGGAGFQLVDREDALAWLAYEAQRQGARARRFLQQNAEDDAREY